MRSAADGRPWGDDHPPLKDGPPCPLPPTPPAFDLDGHGWQILWMDPAAGAATKDLAGSAADGGA